MSLLETYELQKAAQAEEAEKATEEVVEEKTASAEDLEVIEKYAAAADDLLAQEYGDDYEEKDVVELATMMINHDQEEAIEEAEEAEKTASLEEAGRIMAKAFLAEINQAG
jgi:uncharacterized protein YdiU (UPF0061 family)